MGSSRASMELCLMIEGQEGVSWEAWLALARACEEHGVRSLFRSDHYLNLDGHHPERGSLDAWGTICGLAAVTEALRLGTLVSPATFRHPSLLAKLAVTADHISRGRVEVGLGAGWHEREHAAHGFPFADTATRVEVLEEQLQVLLGTWTERPFDFGGRHYQLDALSSQPAPVQLPHPPLILGGSGGRRSLRLAALYADEYNTPFPTLQRIREIADGLHAACAAAGRSRPLPLSVMVGLLVGRDRDELEGRALRLQEIRGGASPLDERPGGWIVGTVEEAVEQLRALAGAGVRRVMLQNLLHADLDVVELIGRELAPALAA